MIALVVIACGAMIGVSLCTGGDSGTDTPRHAF